MTNHTFEPTHYHRTLGPHAPILTIADGDTVSTTTVDAAGQDATGARITPGGNPMTGPFFVGGAELGDTLVVHLDELAPNRDAGWTASALAPNVVDPDYVASLPESMRTTWRIDSNAGTTSPLTEGR